MILEVMGILCRAEYPFCMYRYILDVILANSNSITYQRCCYFPSPLSVCVSSDVRNDLQCILPLMQV